MQQQVDVGQLMARDVFMICRGSQMDAAEGVCAEAGTEKAGKSAEE